MCGRYQLSPEESREIEEIVRKVQNNIKTGEIFPTNQVPILMEAGEEIVPMAAQWGFPRFQGKSGSIINARSETALERPMFRKSTIERRCAIPTTGFFEWGPGEDGKKKKYRFNLPGEKALYLAGIWNEFKGERKCVVLTTEANASLDGIHDRMPLILKREEVEAWVRDSEKATQMLHENPPALEYVEA